MCSKNHNAPIANQLDALYQEGLFNIKANSWQGRRFNSNGKTFLDFTNTNYLGFDFEPSLMTAANEQQREWSNIAGWSRMEVDPTIYNSLEEKIAQFIKCQRVHLSHTITLTNFSLIPSIAKKGFIFADKKLHTVVMEACQLATAHGATIKRFNHQDLNHLEHLLKTYQHIPDKLIAVDGVYSISSALSDIQSLQYLADKYDAWLYIDDAHGFGILGERPCADNPYGKRGNGIVNYFGGDYKRTFYVSSFGKAFCTYTAFASIPDEYQDNIKAHSLQYLFSAPPLPSTIGTVFEVMRLNELQGEKARKKIRSLSTRLVDGLQEFGLNVSNVYQQPVVFVTLGEYEQLVSYAKQLWSLGVIAGLRAHPLVSKKDCGLRFAITALHNEDDIDFVINAFAKAQHTFSNKA